MESEITIRTNRHWRNLTLAKHIRFRLARAIYHREFRLGVAEAHSSFGRTYGHPSTLRSIAYDLGRSKGESVSHYS